MAMIQGQFMPSNPNFVGAGANPNYGKQNSFGNILDFLKKFGASGSQFSVDPTITNKQVGDSLQQQKNFLLPTPAFPMEDTPGFTSSRRKNLINQAVEAAEKTGENADFSGVEVEPKKKPKYREITQEELDDILKNLPKDEEKAPYADYLQKELDFRKDFAGASFMAQGMKNFGDSMMEGSKVFGQDVLPAMVAGTQSVLNAGAQGTRALAGVYGIPIQPIPRMGYYS
tara:strand:+ start:73 stop:756 length:684 start_codon:yes stop_codon:yes gene_type:complete